MEYGKEHCVLDTSVYLNGIGSIEGFNWSVPHRTLFGMCGWRWEISVGRGRRRGEGEIMLE